MREVLEVYQGVPGGKFLGIPSGGPAGGKPLGKPGGIPWLKFLGILGRIPGICIAGNSGPGPAGMRGGPLAPYND